MKEWICNVCGYTHYGDEPPEICPTCGSPRKAFYLKEKSFWHISTITIVLIILLTLLFTLFSCKSPRTVDNSTVPELDLKRYLGKWYEIARFDHRFEKGLQHCTATYTLNNDGKITITNRGIKHGKWKTSVGKGRTTDEEGVLRVSFFWPFYSDYRIMMLAPDYSHVLVGGNGDDYLWILSRTPQLPENTRRQIVNEANRRGYATDNLIWVDQSDEGLH